MDKEREFQNISPPLRGHIRGNAPTEITNQNQQRIMKVEELIKALSEQPQDAEVFYLTCDSGMYQVNTVTF